jgi:YVTN family beta-propeller protein
VYVADTGSNAVTVIDGHDNKVIATIGVGARPTGIGVIPATDLIYVANGGNGKLPGTVSVIDGHRNKVVGSIAVGYDPFGIGVNTISHVVYVGNQGGKGPSTGYAGTVSVIRGTDVDATVTVGGSPFGIGVDSLTNNVYVANYTEGEGDSNVALINGASRLVSQIPLTNPDPEGVTVDQTTHAVFVANSYSGSATGPIGSLSVINGATNAEILSVNVGGNPWGITADPTTDRVYLANDTSPGTVSEVDFRGYPIVGGTPPPTIPTTTTTTPASLAGTLCGLIVKSGAMKTLGLTGSYFVAKNHSVVVPAYGQCEIEQVPPSGHVSLTGVALLYVSDSIPPTAAVPEKPVTGMGAGAAIYTGSEIPCVVWHHGKKFVALEFSWSEEVEASRINAKAPALIAAARQVYALYH